MVGRAGEVHLHIRYTRGVTRRVLLVGGDSAWVRDLFKGLSRDYQVEAADYCDDALTLLMRRSFDVVLVLSLRAPWRTFSSFTGNVESGILFLREMRALHSQVPAIVVSGSAIPEAKEAALANGAFAFIEKPPDVWELDRLVALRPWGRPAGSARRVTGELSAVRQSAGNRSPSRIR